MKFVSWNCAGAFREKFKEIIKENANIYIIQECEDPARTTSYEYNEFAGENYFWIGDNKDKGLGIFAKHKVKLEKLDEYCDTDFKNFLPIRVNDSFNLLGVWTVKGQINGKKIEYVEMIHDFFEKHISLFDENLIICGDFNSNSIWDKLHRTKDSEGNPKDQTNINRKLESSNLISAYHKLNNEEQGKESQNTFYLYRHLDKPYHIDYVYAGKEIVTSLNILDANYWIGLSDHIPIVFETD